MDDSSRASFEIISSLRYDPTLEDSPYYLFTHHYDRLLSAAVDFEWTNAVSRLRSCGIDGLAQILDSENPSPAEPSRVRILVYQNGDIKTEFKPAPPATLLFPKIQDLVHPFSSNAEKFASDPSPPWVVKLDTQVTKPSLFTRYKTTNRECYDTARSRAGIQPSDAVEVLMFSPSGEIMEGSITTPYFYRSQRSPRHDEAGEGLEDVWVTPPLSSGGNQGTTRRYALEAGLCVEEIIGLDDLTDCEEIWLSNGVRGFFKATLRMQ